MSIRIEEDDFPAESHEINVTPFIDVMLVLLIIFMVCAPLATVDVPVNLPSSHAAATPPQAPVFVTVQADQAVVVNDAAVSPTGLAAALESATKGDHTQRIYLRADRSVSYAQLMAVMDQLRDAGFLKISLVALQGNTP